MGASEHFYLWQWLQLLSRWLVQVKICARILLWVLGDEDLDHKSNTSSNKLFTIMHSKSLMEGEGNGDLHSHLLMSEGTILILTVQLQPLQSDKSQSDSYSLV